MFFRKIGKIFNNNIEIQSESLTKPVYLAMLKRSKFKIGNKLNVPEGYTAFIIHKGKVLDSFEKGSHKLSTGTMPETMKKVKPIKRKSGKKVKYIPVKKIKGDITFVSSAKFDVCSFDNIGISIDTNGLVKQKRINVRIGICVTTDVIDKRKLLKNLLSESARLNEERIIKIFKKWVTEILITYSEINNRTNLDELINNTEEFVEKFKSKMEPTLYSLGLSLNEMFLQNVFLPKKHDLQLDFKNTETDNETKPAEEVNKQNDNENLVQEKLTDEEKSDNLKRCRKCGSVLADTQFVCKSCRSINI